MIVATTGHVDHVGTALMPVSGAALPLILRCHDDDASVLTRLDRGVAP